MYLIFYARGLREFERTTAIGNAIKYELVYTSNRLVLNDFTRVDENANTKCGVTCADRSVRTLIHSHAEFVSVFTCANGNMIELLTL